CCYLTLSPYTTLFRSLNTRTASRLNGSDSDCSKWIESGRPCSSVSTHTTPFISFLMGGRADQLMSESIAEIRLRPSHIVPAEVLDRNSTRLNSSHVKI